MKTKPLILAAALALPIGAFSANFIKDDANAAWSTTKSAATKTGEFVENGAMKAGRTVEHGVSATGSAVERGLSPIGERLRHDPTSVVTITKDDMILPGSVSAGSDITVRNRSNEQERFEIKGNGIEGKSILKPGETRRLDLNLPAGNYRVISDQGSSSLHVR